MVAKFDYTLDYKYIDLRKQPELYRVGIGEQGVLLVEPYKSEILPFWRFRTPEIALISAKKIYALFLGYLKSEDFVGADMARKFLQMGYTRSRRYANHPSGRKYLTSVTDNEVTDKRTILPQAEDWKDSPFAESAKIYYGFYIKAKKHKQYQKMLACYKQKWD